MLLPPEEVISPFDNFTITLHQNIAGKEQVRLVDPQYLPRRHGKAWGGRLGLNIQAAWGLGWSPAACNPQAS